MGERVETVVHLKVITPFGLVEESGFHLEHLSGWRIGFEEEKEKKGKWTPQK